MRANRTLQHDRAADDHRRVVDAQGRRAAGELYEVEHEVLAPKVQFPDEYVAIVTYTLLMRYTTAAGVSHTQHIETPVFHRREGGWQLVHCHKSPMWQAPYKPD